MYKATNKSLAGGTDTRIHFKVKNQFDQSAFEVLARTRDAN
jgi:hypothetical protein